MNETGTKKYEHLAKEVKILENVGSFEKCALMEGKSFFGWDSISIRYGLIGQPGIITEETDRLHTHDYDQLLWLVSSDPNDMLELGAELEVTLGTNGVRHIVDIPTLIVIPAGTPHFSPIVRKVDRKFYFLSINCTGEFKADIYDEKAEQGEGCGPWAEFHAEYNKNIRSLHFARKGPHNYGSAMVSDSGGIYAHINSGITGVPITMTWQTITKPHWLGPRTPMMTYAPHVHPFDETLIFLSLDQNDLTDIHASATFCFGTEGEDQESYTVTKATAMTMPAGTYHLPLHWDHLDQPMIFISLSASQVFSAQHKDDEKK